MGNVPDLVAHLHTEFTNTPRIAGTDTVESFVAFARAYLDENRPVEMFSVDSNVGLLLSNNIRVLACPEVTDGDIADTYGSVAITVGREQSGLGMAHEAPAIRVF